jgi:hypothetical protein
MAITVYSELAATSDILKSRERCGANELIIDLRLRILVRWTLTVSQHFKRHICTAP